MLDEVTTHGDPVVGNRAMADVGRRLVALLVLRWRMTGDPSDLQ